MFTPIRHILPETVKKNGMAPKVAKARVFALFEETARQQLPEEVWQEFKALRFVDGTLTIACRSFSVVSALRRNEEALMQTVKEAGGDRLQFLLSPWR